MKRPNREPDFILGICEIYIKERIEVISFSNGDCTLTKLKFNKKESRLSWNVERFNDTPNWMEYDQTDVVSGLLEMCIFEGIK